MTLTAQSLSCRTPDHPVVRLVVLSDTHNRHNAVTPLLPPSPAGASKVHSFPFILIHCGDFADRGSRDHVRSFCRWLATDENNDDYSYCQSGGLPSHFQEVIVVDGNHDMTRPSSSQPRIDLKEEFRKCNQILREKSSSNNRRVHFLQDESITLFGIDIHGISWERISDPKRDIWETTKTTRIPNIIVSHQGPYLSTHHRSLAQPLSGCRIDYRAWRGSERLLQTVEKHQIPLVLSGHVHWSRGAIFIPNHKHRKKDQQHSTETSKECNPAAAGGGGGTWWVNASTTKPGINTSRQASATGVGVCDGDRLQVTSPVVIDYHVQEQRVVHISCPSH